MLKPLRNPIALLLLTTAVLFWTFRVASLPRDIFKTIFVHDWDDSPPVEYIDGDTHRPAYELARWCMGKATDRPFEIGISLSGTTSVVRDANGLCVFYHEWHTFIDEPLDFEIVADVSGTRRVDEYGLLSGFAVRHRTTVESYPFPASSRNTLTPAELDEAMNNSLNPDAPRVINGVQTKWVFRPLAAAHDLGYLITLIAWLYALVAIPRWNLWQPRNACPSCNYPTTGLASPTCPECGREFTSQPVN